MSSHGHAFSVIMDNCRRVRRETNIWALRVVVQFVSESLNRIGKERKNGVFETMTREKSTTNSHCTGHLVFTINSDQNANY